MKRLLFAALLTGALHIPAAPTLAATVPYCRPGEVPLFHFGFATLKAALGPGMGDPIDCEHAQSTGISVQNTTNGMAYYVQRSNTAAFIPTFGVAPQPSHDTWALAPNGLLYFWQGSAAEPPDTAVELDPTACDMLAQEDSAAFGQACFDFYAMSLGDPLAAPSPSSAPIASSPAASRSVAGSSQAPATALGPAVTTPPADDQLQVGLSHVDAGLGDSFPIASGQVCNNTSSWDAKNITINFIFYDRDGFRTLDSGTYQIDQVRAGDCERFRASLTALAPWREIGVGHVNWTWHR